ncbi:MAG TPA: Rad52/Rad22 family DNA repair protein [Jiangellaceae bacterium]|nr:Rad52/Rad22 family DNA repair protein [Jiangellaceae bacterium]
MLTREQYDKLTEPLHPSRISKVQGMSHLEAWDVRRHLIRIFGFGGWEFLVGECALVKEIVVPPDKPNGKDRYTVVYRVIGRLIIKDANGDRCALYEDGATGDAVNQPSLGDAHDLALKSAMSQALKRCAVNLGDQFGLSLYKDGDATAVVGRSVIAPEPDVADTYAAQIATASVSGLLAAGKAMRADTSLTAYQRERLTKASAARLAELQRSEPVEPDGSAKP